MHIDDTAALGRAVRGLRKKLGVTQSELAMTSGTGLRFIVDLEKGKPTCRTGKVLQVLRTLGARIDLEPPPGLVLEDAEEGTAGQR